MLTAFPDGDLTNLTWVIGIFMRFGGSNRRSKVGNNPPIQEVAGPESANCPAELRRCGASGARPRSARRTHPAPSRNMYPMPRTVSSAELAVRPVELVPQARDERLDRVGRDLFVEPVERVGDHRFAHHRPRPAHEQFEQFGFLVGQRNLGIMVMQAARGDVEGQVADMELAAGCAARGGAARRAAGRRSRRCRRG